MELCFEVLCLTLHAEIAPVMPDEYDDGEMQFITLTCDGKDASFLFTSNVLTEMIYEAAWGAFEVWATNQQRLYEEDRAADRAADRAFELEHM